MNYYQRRFEKTVGPVIASGVCINFEMISTACIASGEWVWIYMVVNLWSYLYPEV